MVHDVLQEHTFSQLRHKYFPEEVHAEMVPSVQHGSSHEISMEFSPKQVGGKFGTTKIHDISTRLPEKKKKTRRPYTRFFLTASSAETPPRERRKSFNPPSSGANSHVSFSGKIKTSIFPPKKKQSSKNQATDIEAHLQDPHLKVIGSQKNEIGQNPCQTQTLAEIISPVHVGDEV